MQNGQSFVLMNEVSYITRIPAGQSTYIRSRTITWVRMDWDSIDNRYEIGSVDSN